MEAENAIVRVVWPLGKIVDHKVAPESVEGFLVGDDLGSSGQGYTVGFVYKADSGLGTGSQMLYLLR